MKLGDFTLLDDEEQAELSELLARFNQTRSDYPRDKTTHQLFAEQAARTPDATAVIYGEGRLTYAELDRHANQLARCLVERGLVQPEQYVGLMLDRSLEMMVAILAILKAGGAYVPINPDLPPERIRYLLCDTRAPLLFFEKRYTRKVNRLQWECPDLTTIFCVDSIAIHAELEEAGGMMDQGMWQYIADEAFDDISGGGWKNSYTGEWLSREVMDEYGENIRTKLAPHLTAQSRVMEIGCATGISMFRLAPLVGRYYGTDLSQGIVAWSQREAERRGLAQIRLRCLAAHEVDQLDERDFDVVVINSVIECFNGHNYLREVLRKSLDLIGEQGILFLGNVWDQDTKEGYEASLLAFRQAHAGRGYHTKVDRSEELFLSRAFLEDLRHEFPEIVSIEFSEMLGTAESELSQFGFDALLRVDKRAGAVAQPCAPRSKLQLDRSVLGGVGEEPLPERSRAEGLAYLMYTSGSTGQPKGVMVEHRAIVRLVINSNYVTFQPTDRTVQAGSLGFDASTFEIWGALLNGTAVCLPQKNVLLEPGGLARLIARQKVTVLFLTTGLFNQFVEMELGLFAGLRMVLTGGEKVSVRHINTLRQVYPALALLHVYGPTENTTFSTYYPVVQNFTEDVPIGYPLANSSVYILDGALEPVPIGVPGELCTGGDGLARGYLNAPALTAQKFIPHPVAAGERLYRTGDLARWMADGAVEYLGRMDDQMKVRGYRIEPAEIEHHLLAVEAVKGAVVVALRRGWESAELVAYLVGTETLDIGHLRDQLKESLPDYMIPAHFVHLDKFPLNQNGKVDRKALPVPDLDELTGAITREPPRTETERQLAEVWAEVLGRRQVGVTEDFFESGGHSLKVTRLVSLIQQRMGVTLPLKSVFLSPTVRELAQTILDHAHFGAEVADEAMILLNGQHDGRAIFAFPPGTGDALGFVQVAEGLKPFAFYGFNFIEAEDRLQRYADLIAQIQPEGPYLLFGYSSGGNLAYHVARVLEERGQRVSDIVMVDSSRKLGRYPFSDEQVLGIAQDFLQHESIAPYLTNPILQEKVIRQIQRSYTYVAEAVDRHEVQANIHVLRAEGAVDEAHDEGGELLASTAAWAEATRGTFTLYQAHGDHNHLLYPPYLDRNVALLRQIFHQVRGSLSKSLL